MLKKLEINIIQELLGLPGIEVEEIFLRDNHELLINCDFPGSLCRAKIF